MPQYGKKCATSSALLALSLLIVLGCSEAPDNGDDAHGSEMVANSKANNSQPLPTELKVGEEKFDAYCSRCHGVRGKGTNNGPPLVHKIYEPNHHADFTFQRAAARGVRAHHWKFGNMPKIDGVTSDDVDEIIRYIRWLQRQAGIF